MGRLLEMLKSGEGRREPAAILAPVDAGPMVDRVVDWEIGEEVPYVEVGGPNRKVELSPSLLRHPPQKGPQPPHHALEPTSAPPIAKRDLKPISAAFQPWPTVLPLAIDGEVIAFHQPDHPASGQYANLLDAMLAGVPAETVLCFIAARPQVGAGTVLLNLAATAALKRKSRVVVVEARPGLAMRLGYAPCPGLAEVFAGALAPEQALRPTGIASLRLLSVGLTPATPTNAALAWLLGWLRQRCDLVLIHGPTMDDADAVNTLVPHAGGMFLVLPQGESAAATRGFAQAIATAGGRLCGLIHTHFD